MSTYLPRTDYDPAYLNARREAAIIFLVWVACFLWSLPYCYLSGYGAEAGPPDTLWGIPTWVVWGIAIPWLAADGFTLWMCIRYMRDDDLGEAPAAGPAESGE
ncbi:hypothetical protein ACFL6X_08390 [Candidatus Latescibacterota bacterium]